MAKTRGVTVAEFEAQAAASDKLDRNDMETPLLGLVGEVGGLLSALKKKSVAIRMPSSVITRRLSRNWATSYGIFQELRSTGGHL